MPYIDLLCAISLTSVIIPYAYRDAHHDGLRHEIDEINSVPDVRA